MEDDPVEVVEERGGHDVAALHPEELQGPRHAAQEPVAARGVPVRVGHEEREPHPGQLAVVDDHRPRDQTLGEQQPLWRNIFVGRALVNRWGMLRVAEEKRVTMEILRRYVGLQGRAITADTPVQTLSGGERQGVAIGRAMYFDARLVVLDEPTTALSLGEVDRVLTFIEQLSAQGKACILISHNVGYIYRVASRFLILDRGEMVASYDRRDISLVDLHGRLLQIHGGAR